MICCERSERFLMAKFKGQRAIVEWGLTVAMALAILAGYSAAQKYRDYSVERAAVLSGPKPGSVLKIPGEAWERHGVSLVFVMQVGCHWCEASSDFYASLLRSSLS